MKHFYKSRDHWQYFNRITTPVLERAEYCFKANWKQSTKEAKMYVETWRSFKTGNMLYNRGICICYIIGAFTLAKLQFLTSRILPNSTHIMKGYLIIFLSNKFKKGPHRTQLFFFIYFCYDTIIAKKGNFSFCSTWAMKMPEKHPQMSIISWHKSSIIEITLLEKVLQLFEFLSRQLVWALNFFWLQATYFHLKKLSTNFCFNIGLCSAFHSNF